VHALPRWSPKSLRFFLIFAILSFVLLQPGFAQGQSENKPALQTSSHLTPAVIYTSDDYHIHEIALKGTWQDRDLTAAASAPLIKSSAAPMAFRRNDGVSMVVYRGVDDHIYTLYLELDWQASGWQEIWHWADLTAITSAPVAASDPYGYVRGDGVSTVIYTSSDGHINELRLESVWIWADLTVIPSSPAARLNSTPVAYVRADGVSTIVYRAASNNHICELRLEDTWQWGDLTAISGATLPYSDLSAYLRSDGVSAVVYTGTDYHVHEIWLGTAWTWADLTLITGAPTTLYNKPHGYVRSDGINAVVYSHYSTYYDFGKIYELRLDDGWKSYELTSVTVSTYYGSCPMGFVRADGVSSVIYGDLESHADEIRLEADGWHWADLTYISGGANLISCPFPYNRNSVGNTYLPLVVR
jgi:hypothetical protein